MVNKIGQVCLGVGLAIAAVAAILCVAIMVREEARCAPGSWAVAAGDVFKTGCPK